MPPACPTALDRVLPHHRALIFDCDGTLADSMPVHWRAWNTAFTEREWNSFPAYATYMTWGGISGEAVARRAAAHQPTPADLADVVTAKQTHYLALATTIAPIEPVLAVARAFRGQRPMAVATGSRRASVQRTLTTIGAQDWFDALISADDVAHHKPHPETYLKAAEALGVKPQDCLAFEDAPPGLESAQAAGMDVVDVRTYTPAHDSPAPSS